MTKTLDKAIAEMEKAHSLTDSKQELLGETVLQTIRHVREIGDLSLDELSQSMSDDAAAKGLTKEEARRIASDG